MLAHGWRCVNTWVEMCEHMGGDVLEHGLRCSVVAVYTYVMAQW